MAWSDTFFRPSCDTCYTFSRTSGEYGYIVREIIGRIRVYRSGDHWEIIGRMSIAYIISRSSSDHCTYACTREIKSAKNKIEKRLLSNRWTSSWDANEMSMRCQWDANEMPMRCQWDASETNSDEYFSNAIDTTLEIEEKKFIRICLWDTLEANERHHVRYIIYSLPIMWYSI